MSMLFRHSKALPLARHLSSSARPTKCVGVVREVYNKWERRAPLTPSHVQELVQAGVAVHVQPSNQRIFTNDQYTAAGAKVTDDLSSANVIVGVKQVPIANLLADKTYLFFSHTIKAQPENMALLDAVLDKNVRLIDYECITEGGKRNGRRLIAFGGYAGRAGMLAGFRGLGERLINKGYSSPFVNIGSAYMYQDLGKAKEAVATAGDLIKKNGLPADLAPMVVTFTGNGNVSQGAQEVFKLLPHEFVTPEELPHLKPNRHVIYGCVVDEKHMVQHKTLGNNFTKDDYYKHPENYEPIFHKTIAPYTSLLVNAMYWDDRYPRLLTKDQIETITAESGGDPKLLGVADISCDIGGSVEFLEKSTYIEDPFFLYDIKSRSAKSSLAGEPGIMMMGVDILPSELPSESSQHFGNHLVGFLQNLSAGEQNLPDELQGAVIAANGKLAPKYEYIKEMRRDRERAAGHAYASAAAAAAGSTCIELQGHLFDTGLINHVLDLIEAHNGGFAVVECNVRPNFNADASTTSTAANISRAVVQISMDSRAELDAILAKITTLSGLTPGAEAKVAELPDYCKGTYDQTLAQRASTAKEGAGMTFAGTATVQDAKERKHIVCLGAGLVASPLVEYLTRDADHTLTVVSGLAGEADAMAAKYTARHRSVTAATVNVGTQQDAVASLVHSADCVVSLLPAPMHVNIAKTCLEAATPLVTASYISPEMQALHAQAQARHIPILCELGLDPGMDHMSAMKIIDDVQARGGRVAGFSSVCGGLPAPEAADNPIAYKFSWSPRGVLTAALNSAQYLKNGKVVQVEGENLLTAAERVNFLPAFALEQIPNRNSLPYAEIYNIPDADSIFRGTLRYAGNCAIMHQMRLLGLLNTAETALPVTWPELLGRLKASASTRLTPEAEAFLTWLGLDEPSALIDPSAASPIDAFCALLMKKLAYLPGERDMAVMHHEFDVEFADRRELITSTYVGYGDDESTVMAKTVGMSAAIGVDLILRGDVRGTGVLTPTTPDIYNPGLARLEAEGIRFIEKVRAMPK